LSGAAASEVVIGRRRIRRDRFARRVAARVANGARRAVLRDGASDTGCSLKLFPREAFLALPSFDGMHRFLPALFRQHERTLCEVEVGHRPRRAGRSKYSNRSRLARTLVDLLGVLWLSRRVIPPRR
jgi:dolichol-phosphate mannosyltransferase